MIFGKKIRLALMALLYSSGDLASSALVVLQNDSLAGPSGGKVQAAYFTNWGIYGANFQPSDINTKPLSHILYAFADILSDGTVTLTDPYADEQKHFSGDSWDDPGNNLYGCLKQLYLLKLSHRNIKVILSIGGWTYSQSNHFSFVTNQSSRAVFVKSAVQFIMHYGFDGIDLDFEYPANDAQGQGFADLLTSLREAFDELANLNGDTIPYQLSAAVPAGESNYINLKVAQMDRALTHWNLMSYDYAGAWLSWADNQANLYGGERTNVNTDGAVSWYIQHGATPEKINLGIPLYGRAFENTDGIGQSYSGVGPGTTDPGIYSYSKLPLSGASVHENFTDVTSYSYDASKKEFVTYDTPNIAALKAQYVIAKELGGGMFWDLSTDKTGSQDSLVSVTANVFGTIDQTQNHIHYPNSRWDNIRSNMGQTSPGHAPNSSVPPPQETVPTTTSSASTVTSLSTASPGPPSDSCSGTPPWNASETYVGKIRVIYAGHLWAAKWWNQGIVPGGPDNVWEDNGACTVSRRLLSVRSDGYGGRLEIQM